MLKPYVCVACEKVIIGKDDIASLIGLFSKFTMVAPSGTEVPPNAVAPKEWCVFSIWDIEEGDASKELTLHTKILYPDGSQFADIVKAKMILAHNKRSQMLVNVPGFPVGQIGDYTVSTWIEENQSIVAGPIEFKLAVERATQVTTPN